MSWSRSVRALFVVLLCAGCADRTPELLVDGRNPRAYQGWRSQVIRRFTPEGWREFNDAIDQIRMRAMAAGVTGTEAIDAAMCREVHGLTPDAVVRLGEGYRLQELQSRGARLKIVIDANARLAAQPGNEAIATAMQQRREDHDRLLRQTTDEMEACVARLLRYGASPEAFVRLDALPTVLSRHEAMTELDAIVEARRRNAALYYGDWPATVDRDGSLIQDADVQEEFAACRAAAAPGHSVIAVYVRARWRFFDAPVKLPEFSSAMVGNLTADDRQRFAEQWIESEAEAWARRQASAESAETAAAAYQDAMMSQAEGGRR